MNQRNTFLQLRFFPKKAALFSIFALVTFAHGTAQESTNETASAAQGIRYEHFELILDNNIFNSNREDRARLEAERQRARESSVPVDRFSLVGTMHNNDESLAFFSGSSSRFNAVLKTGEQIEGYAVKEIQEKNIVLEKEGNEIDFSVGMGMTRRGDDPWEVVQNAGSDFRGSSGSGRSRSGSRPSRGPSRDNRPPSRTSSNSSSSSSSTATSEPDAASKSDILKRMMERRRQQMNQ